MASKRQRIWPWAVFCLLALLVAFGYSPLQMLYRLNQAAERVRAHGGELRYLMFVPKYVEFAENVSDETLADLEPAWSALWSVEQVILRGSHVSPGGIRPLRSLLNLHVLDLRNTSIGVESVDELRAIFPDVDMVDIWVHDPARPVHGLPAR